MQEAIPFRTWAQPIRPSTSLNNMKTTTQSRPMLPNDESKTDELKRIVEEKALTVFAPKGCCLGHVVKCLLQGLGANPYVYDVEEKDIDVAVEELEGADAGFRGKEGRRVQFPAVFIGGRWFGGLERVMAAHITGELTPLLKQAGALWL